MLYQEPRMEILKFETEDVICASDGGTYEPGKDNNYSDASNPDQWT